MASGQKSKAMRSNGVTLSMGDGASPEVFTTIYDVVGVDDTPPEAEEIEVTQLNSPQDDQGNINKEFIMGLIDPGSYTLTLNYTLQDGQDKLLEAVGSNKNFHWDFPMLKTAERPNGTRLSFTATVKPFVPQVDPKGVIKATCKLRVSGARTFDAIPAV